MEENNKENEGTYGKRIEWQASTVRIKYAVDEGVGVNVERLTGSVDGSERFHINILNTNTYYKMYKSY